MAKLPKNFPEYSLMYKTLNKKILELQDKLDKSSDKNIQERIQHEIENYQKESDRIKSLFPEKFFNDK